MNIQQEFDVPHAPAIVWAFLDRPRDVAACVPGVEEIEELAPDNFRVLVTQKVGPISATFRAKVAIIDKIEGKSMRIVSTGQVARGAAGSFRSEVTVTLMPEGTGSRLRVDADVALAGMLGSVGQSVVQRHAAALSETFAANLVRRLSPDSSDRPALGADPANKASQSAKTPKPEPTPVGVAVSAPAGAVPDPAFTHQIGQTEFWARVAAGASLGTLAVVLVLLGRSLG